MQLSTVKSTLLLFRVALEFGLCFIIAPSLLDDADYDKMYCYSLGIFDFLRLGFISNARYD